MEASQDLMAGLKSAARISFEQLWKKHSHNVEISDLEEYEGGLHCKASFDCPFDGTTNGEYSFEWSAVLLMIEDPNEIEGVEDSVTEWLSENFESDGHSELCIDEDGRVHAASTMRWLSEFRDG
ncbi:hypothetical protein [Mangrovicoccus sp. HB161399]|uniref:hypothetical protein n=1 Tax=Mangrovicoccus sp. HB161399 TaxID=2720392 RepID=UPI001552A5AD|nr:hypothetical protein [Mangrovicoccus sp. HB161399]